jgi:Na+/proline symporter
MNTLDYLDWFVLLSTLFFIVAYGTWKTRKNKDLESYLKGGNEMGWATIGLSVMATQASAITFISTPGQAFESGMGFVQNYFGLPLALIVVSAFFIPIYYKLKVYTAYEYLESRFDKKTRLLAASLFLIQRGLAAGITIYAPAIILSSVLDINLTATILFVGILVIIYTVSGGTKAVSLTQTWQMGVIFLGMFIAFFIILNRLPEGVGFFDALSISGKMGKLDAINFSFDIKERYTFWSGITGGFFLALSYFGTDQSQVQRYLSGKNIRQSRMGLMFNALAKVPMQYFILLVGVMVFVFYQFQSHPLLFDHSTTEFMHQSANSQEFEDLENKAAALFNIKKEKLETAMSVDQDLEPERYRQLLSEAKNIETQYQVYRANAKDLVIETDPEHSTKDSDYVFLSFILKYMPNGIIGLLLAVIISAAMSSTAGELNALASTTTIDFYKRLIKPNDTPKHFVKVSKYITMFWGIMAILFAIFAQLLENLIEAVNILGSVFYGTILGIFLVAFMFKKVKGNTVFIAAITAQLVVFILFAFYQDYIAYLWFNVIGCGLVMIISLVLTQINRSVEIELVKEN